MDVPQSGLLKMVWEYPSFPQEGLGDQLSKITDLRRTAHRCGWLLLPPAVLPELQRILPSGGSRRVSAGYTTQTPNKQKTSICDEINVAHYSYTVDPKGDILPIVGSNNTRVPTRVVPEINKGA